MKILVLFDGAGLARLGLEQAGHECTGVELDPTKHELSRHVGSGNCVLGDARAYFSEHVEHGRRFDAVWASPPCVRRTSCIKDLTKAEGLRDPKYQGDHLSWSLRLRRRAPHLKALWVENVTQQGDGSSDAWGTTYNAAQFLSDPIQNRNRVIGGHYLAPTTCHDYRRWFPGVCPCITATEYKASGATDKCRASRFYGRNLDLNECAFHQGFEIPVQWSFIPNWFMPNNRHRAVHWTRNQYVAIGNGVPVYMAYAFGDIYNWSAS